MTVSDDFKKIIDDDIEGCAEQYAHGDKESRWRLYTTLISKYTPIIQGFQQDFPDMFYDSNGTRCRETLETIRQKLILFKAMGYENTYADKPSSVTLNNSTQVDISINISFEDARCSVENMSALKESEIQEILAKVDELEGIVSSSDRKTKKWEKARDIIKWVADKGVDVGIALLPLILKINQ